MDDLTPHLSWIFEALAVIAGITYLYYRRVRHRMLRVRCAEMLLVELRNIWTDVDLAKGNYIPDLKAYFDLPHSVYDGLITSTNISYFDVDIQHTLHSLYTHVHRYNMIAELSREGVTLDNKKPFEKSHISRPMAEANLQELVKKWDDAINEVEEFRDEYEPEGWERSVAVTFGLIDKE